MRYFIEVCRTGSISKAADNLFLSQQGLSGSIRRLEKELGCDLFYRKAGGLVLTSTGEIFKNEAETILKKVDYVIDYCTSLNIKQKKVAVACTGNIIVRLPGKLQMILLNQTDDADDDFSVDYTETWTLDCEALVNDGNVAFGIVFGECDRHKFDVIELATLRQVFIVNRLSRFAQQDSVSLKELDGIPLIVPHDRCRPGIKMRELFKRAGARLNIATDCDRPRQTIDLVSHNPYLVARIIADDITHDDLAMVKPLTLQDDPYLLPICLINKKGRQFNMAEKYFQFLVVNCYK